MHTNRRSVVIILGSLLACSAVGCGMRSSLDEGDSIEEITAASALDSGMMQGAGGTEERSFCGDGRLDLLTEQCDGTNLGYATCESLGQGVGRLRCSPGCYFDVSMCRPPVTPPTEPPANSTTPVGPDETGYGSNPFSNLGNLFNRDAGADGGRTSGGRNTRRN